MTRAYQVRTVGVQISQMLKDPPVFETIFLKQFQSNTIGVFAFS